MTIIYTKNNCQPCRLTKAAFDRKGVAYEERNIDENPDYREDLVELGYMSAPVILSKVGNWTGLVPEAINQLAKAA